MSELIEHIVILGGGTAGWLTAGILAAEYQARGGSTLQITLIESPDVPTIGVGEGTWPSMRLSLQRIGLSEIDVIQQCDASFKQGSKFVGWKNGLPDDIYYHPFTAPQGFGEANFVAAWREHFSHLSFADTVCIQSQLCEQGFAPKQKTTPEYAGVLNYGYHFDAGKFAQLLQKHCTQKLGVKHLLDHVTQVVSAASGDIAALLTKQSGAVAGDLFIDCSGTNCLLLGEHYGIPFIDKNQFSINDRALAVQVPYRSSDDPIASPTIATAQDAGWTWDIGLSSRRGVGYVYSSSHSTDEHAEQTLRAYVSKSIGPKNIENISVKRLSIRPGHREKFWHKNCVAVGMAAGFIEPLEASALALVELSATSIRDNLPLAKTDMAIVAKRFNEVFCCRWQGIIDFLKLHYALSERNDTVYWRDVTQRDNLSKPLAEHLSLWRQRPPAQQDFIHGNDIFPAASYQYVLYGMGFKPLAHGIGKTSDRIDFALRNINDNIERARKYMTAIPTNRELLAHINQYGMQRI